MAIPNIFKRRQRRILNTSVNDFLTQPANNDNSEVPPSIQLSQSEDESSARLNSSDEDAPPTSSTKSNSDEDKPLTPLKKKGLTDRFARDCRQGFKELGKELGDKGGKNIKEGMLIASEKVKEGVKEAGEKAGDKVKEGLISISDKFSALILIINFTWLVFFIWLNH